MEKVEEKIHRMRGKEKKMLGALDLITARHRSRLEYSIGSRAEESLKRRMQTRTIPS